MLIKNKIISKAEIVPGTSLKWHTKVIFAFTEQCLLQNKESFTTQFLWFRDLLFNVTAHKQRPNSLNLSSILRQPFPRHSSSVRASHDFPVSHSQGCVTLSHRLSLLEDRYSVLASPGHSGGDEDPHVEGHSSLQPLGVSQALLAKAGSRMLLNFWLDFSLLGSLIFISICDHNPQTDDPHFALDLEPYSISLPEHHLTWDSAHNHLILLKDLHSVFFSAPVCSLPHSSLPGPVVKVQSVGHYPTYVQLFPRSPDHTPYQLTTVRFAHVFPQLNCDW